jgi:RNA polymerase sigma-70 factor (ECF subfamily)
MDTTQTSIVSFLQHADWRSNDSEHWTRFVNLYSPLFHEYARRLRVPESERADIVQDMFVQVLRKISRFRRQEDGSFRGWLFLVLKNVWLDRVRRKKLPLEMDADQNGLADSVDPATLIAAKEYREFVLRRVYGLVLAEFSSPNQRVFQRLVVEGISPQQVADEMNLTVNSVYLVRSRMLRRIREELSELLDD